MVVFEQGKRPQEFILSEAPGQRSRENGVLAEGENLAAGTVLMASGANLVAYDAAGESTAVGILMYNVNATDAAQAVSYLARDAEVNQKLLVYPEESSEGGEEAATIASLADLGIICRD